MPFSRYLTQKELEATVEEIMMEPNSDQSVQSDIVAFIEDASNNNNLELVVPDNTELPFTLSTENPEWDDESLESKRRLMLSTNDRLASTVKWKKGYHTLPRIQHYWSTEEDKGIDLVKRCMSRNRFQSIKQNLHLSDNSILDKNDKISKVRPFSDVITKKIYSLMNKWYITLAASKPVRFRFKLWCLCSSDGYLFYSTPYGVAQNQTHSNLGLGGDKPVNHQIFFDNFFHHSNSSYILQNNGYFVTGTIRENRTNKCPMENCKLFKDILAPAIDEVRYDNQGHLMISHANKARRRCRLRNTRVCYRCTKSTSTYETEGILNLSMRSLELCRLEELMHDYLCDYLVSDFSCQECNSTMTIVNKRRVVVEPEVLVIALKRYICNERMEP
nr:unnamed protein product [Callosobruchus chinensis]